MPPVRPAVAVLLFCCAIGDQAVCCAIKACCHATWSSPAPTPRCSRAPGCAPVERPRLRHRERVEARSGMACRRQRQRLILTGCPPAAAASCSGPLPRPVPPPKPEVRNLRRLEKEAASLPSSSSATSPGPLRAACKYRDKSMSEVGQRALCPAGLNLLLKKEEQLPRGAECRHPIAGAGFTAGATPTHSLPPPT